MVRLMQFIRTVYIIFVTLSINFNSKAWQQKRLQEVSLNPQTFVLEKNESDFCMMAYILY